MNEMEYNGKKTASLTTGHQPHSMWLKPLTFLKSANRQLKQTAINKFTPRLTIVNLTNSNRQFVKNKPDEL